MMSDLYDKHYYTSSNYSNYLEREDRYRIMTKELISTLDKFSMISRDSVILDYGCAIGYVPRALSDYGFSKVYGYEISKWAKKQALLRGVNMVDELGAVDVLLAFDVFEHMTNVEIEGVFDECDADVLIGRIPCAAPGEQTFHLDVSRQDPTHINCKDKRSWKTLFSAFGYHMIFPLNLNTIYDSTGVMSFVAFNRNCEYSI